MANEKPHILLAPLCMRSFFFFDSIHKHIQDDNIEIAHSINDKII